MPATNKPAGKKPKAPAKAGAIEEQAEIAALRKSFRLLASAENDEMHKGKLAYVLRRDTENASGMLKFSAQCFELGIPLPRRFAEYLAKRFRQIAGTKDPFKEILLSIPKGKRHRIPYDRRLQIAVEISRLHDKQGMKLGSGNTGAYAVVMEKFYIKFEDAVACRSEFKRYLGR